MHRVVILASFLVALVAFAYNMATGGDLLYSAFCALCVLFGVSIAMLIALRSVASALLRHLQERQRLHREAEMENLRKQMAKQQQQKGQG
jgi:cytochrome b561